MQKIVRYLLVPLFLLTLACRTLAPASPFPPDLPQVSTPTVTLPPTSVTEVWPVPSQTPSPEPTAESPTSEPRLLPRETFEVRYHPDGELYAGDLISLEVLSPPGVDADGLRVKVRIGPPADERLSPVEFSSFGIGRRAQATFLWSWDTSGLPPGDYQLTFSIEPNGAQWTETVTLAPASQLPALQANAEWTRTETDCCLVYYVTGTEAERDLPQLLEMIQEQYDSAKRKLDFKAEDEPVEIVFLPRVLGHGGFAGREIAVSYLERDYAGGSTAIVLHHELVHWMDARLESELRPTMLVEGLAVYLSGGHFKPEPLMPRAAALLGAPLAANAAPPPASGPMADTVRYLPLAPLADDFYFSQHEIGYLQAGALVEYMVETWGWERFSDFYRNIQPHESGSHAKAIDAALQKHFGLTLEELEADFIQALRREPLNAAHVRDVHLSVEFYDTVRRYQQALDPSAYFLHAWLPDLQEMRQRGIVADFTRRPSAPENLALEQLLVAADEYLRAGDYDRAAETLDAVNAALDVYTGESLAVAIPAGLPFVANIAEPATIRR